MKARARQINQRGWYVEVPYLFFFWRIVETYTGNDAKNEAMLDATIRSKNDNYTFVDGVCQ